MRTSAAAVLVFCLASVALPHVRRRPVRREAMPPIARPGENYHVEIGGFLWIPTPDIAITSESLGIVGSQDRLRHGPRDRNQHVQADDGSCCGPSTKHKFRFEYTPITYTATGTLKRNIIFNGISYPVSLPVDDRVEVEGLPVRLRVRLPLSRSRASSGLLLEAKYTDVQATLSNAHRHRVRPRARADSRHRVHRPRLCRAEHLDHRRVQRSSRCPQDISEDYRAKYYDFDLYGTVNFTDHFGAQVGYRSFDVFYHINEGRGRPHGSRACTSAGSSVLTTAVFLRLPTIYSSFTNAPRNRVSRLAGSASFGLNPDVT